uniref:Uncharacterized protein n=1 Tax=Megaselia scalaris TaxID=36166 RepID=T1GEQ6_MEGSC
MLRYKKDTDYIDIFVVLEAGCCAEEEFCRYRRRHNQFLTFFFEFLGATPRLEELVINKYKPENLMVFKDMFYDGDLNEKILRKFPCISKIIIHGTSVRAVPVWFEQRSMNFAAFSRWTNAEIRRFLLQIHTNKFGKLLS